MNSQITNNIRHSMLASALAGLCLATLAYAGNAPAPGGSNAFGKTLAQWQDIAGDGPTAGCERSDRR